MKIKTENIYRISLFVPILFFIKEYLYIFTEIINGNASNSIYFGAGGFSSFLSIPLLAYLLTVLALLILSRRKTAKEIFRIFVFAPVVHSVFITVWFTAFSYLTVTNRFSAEDTMGPILIALVAIIVVIPVGYLFMGIIAGIYLIAKKLGFIDEQYQ